MKSLLTRFLIFALFCCVFTSHSAIATTATNSHHSDLERAITAYRFWFPTVSAEAIYDGNRNIGVKDNESFVALSAKPLHVGFTLNSDTPYAGGVLDLGSGPMVIEIPTGPFIALVNDHHQQWIVDMGIPGQDKGLGGKYLILPPHYKGVIPKGYAIGQSSSYKVLVAIRALPLGGDIDKAMHHLKSVKVYPLSSSTQPKPMKFIDANKMKMDSTPLKWETSLKYWEVLHKIINAEPKVEKFKSMYALLASLGIEKGKPFEPSPDMQKILKEAAQIGHQQLMSVAFESTRQDRIAWQDRKWEWVGLVPTDPNFETPKGLDNEARDRWFTQAIIASPAMFRRQAGTGSLYWLGIRDTKGESLDGGKSYELTIPLPVPADLFWSITVYDKVTRSEIQTDQNQAALRSLFELKNITRTESIKLYFGPTPPANKEIFWIKTIPGKEWFAYFRIYGPEQPLFNNDWKPSDFVEIK